MLKVEAHIATNNAAERPETPYNRPMSKKKPSNPDTIAVNKRATYEYFIEEKYEAGIALEGWEVKAIRAGKISLGDAYIYIRNTEAFLIGVHITPLITASTHVLTDATRTRKLLLHRKQLTHLIGAIERKGHTCVPLRFYWNRGRVKCEIALVKGKQNHDKRDAEKNRDWQREKGRLMRDRG